MGQPRVVSNPQDVTVATGSLDLVRQGFVGWDGRRTRLTAKEAELLDYLAARPLEAVDRDRLLVEVWGHSEFSLSRCVDATVARLRRKLERDPADPRVLLTVHGQGYRLVLGAEPAFEAPEPAPTRPALTLGARTIDLMTGEVHGPDGVARLTNRERGALEQLLGASGAWVTAERLGRVMGLGRRFGALANAIYRLRARLEDDPRAPVFLESARGLGYRLAVRAEPAPVADRERRRALRSITDHIGLLLGMEDCVVYLREGDALVQAAAWGPKRGPDGEVRDPLWQRLDEGLVGAAATSGLPVRVADVAEDPRYLADLVTARSELAVPIVAGSRVVGVIDSESTRPDRFSDRDEAVFVSLAAIAAAAFPPGGTS